LSASSTDLLLNKAVPFGNLQVPRAFYGRGARDSPTEYAMPMKIDPEWIAAFIAVLSIVSFACIYITQPKG
jgi:hypothetical protein